MAEPSNLTPARVPLADAQLSPFGEPQQEVECLEHDQLHEEEGDPEEAASVSNRRSTPRQELPDPVQEHVVNDEDAHIDFVTAFLNGPIDCEIYMKQPEFFDDGTGRVCRLLQSLYGLKQAPRIWYKTLDKYLRQCGFQRSKMDGGIYFRWVDGSPIFWLFTWMTS